MTDTNSANAIADRNKISSIEPRVSVEPRIGRCFCLAGAPSATIGMAELDVAANALDDLSYLPRARCGWGAPRAGPLSLSLVPPPLADRAKFACHSVDFCGVRSAIMVRPVALMKAPARLSKVETFGGSVQRRQSSTRLNVDLGIQSELVVLFDHHSKIWKEKYQIERNKQYNETQCDDCE